MRCFITVHSSLYFLLISYISSLSSSILVEATPVSSTHTEIWQPTEKEHSSPHLVKRISSIFPNTGHGSTTFNVIHVIAAVIGIIGATVLMIVLVLYYKRKRRRLIAETTTAPVVNTRSPYGHPSPSSLSIASSSFNNGCRSSLNPQSSIPSSFPDSHHRQHHRKPSSTMSQFQVFQSDYYYDDEKQHLQTEKLIQNQSSSSSPYPFMPSPPPQCHAGQHHPYTSIPIPSPPPYKP